MLGVPQYPSLKNFTLTKLRGFSVDMFPGKVVRVNAKPVRQINGMVGMEFQSIEPVNQKIIGSYVDTFLTNIVHLLSLIDMVNYDEESLLMVRELSAILGYDSEMKISILRQTAHHDYLSLQWL
jgi:hypothetical protein